jgi:hypothetical protein
MSYVVVDFSKHQAETNRQPPKTGKYTFQDGSGAVISFEGSLKNAVNFARNVARKNGSFTVTLTNV